MTVEESVLEAQKLIADAEALVISAGAGIGVDSGLPDFRGNEGFWKAYPPIARLGISFVEMANPSWFKNNPRLAWAFYGHRFNLYRRTMPHAGYSMLLDLVSRKNSNYFIFTSNVDGQFQKAGFADDRIEECHGSIFHFQCAGPCCEQIWDASLENIAVNEKVFEAIEPFPSCPNCGGIARPNVLMFGDWLWIGKRSQLQTQRFMDWLRSVDRNQQKFVVIEIGAGTAVPAVRHTSEALVHEYSGRLIRINPREYIVPSGNISIPFGAIEGIKKVTNKLLSK
jgi:NAD-dependent SIR2 family protein deacetylase